MYLINIAIVHNNTYLIIQNHSCYVVNNIMLYSQEITLGKIT